MTLSERAAIGFKKKEVKPPAGPQSRLLTRRSDGVIEARSGEGRLLAHYNPATNETRNSRGDLLGTGNRLPKILQAAEATAAARAKHS